jgi:hypothetical protein
VDVVVELVERFLELRVSADTWSHFDELTARGLYVVAMRRNVREVRIGLASRHERQDRGYASYGANS